MKELCASEHLWECVQGNILFIQSLSLSGSFLLLFLLWGLPIKERFCFLLNKQLRRQTGKCARWRRWLEGQGKVWKVSSSWKRTQFFSNDEWFRNDTVCKHDLKCKMTRVYSPAFQGKERKAGARDKPLFKVRIKGSPFIISVRLHSGSSTFNTQQTKMFLFVFQFRGSLVETNVELMN